MTDGAAKVDVKPSGDPRPYDADSVRRDFPILGREAYGKPLVYLDNAASAQKPRQVIDTVREVYENEYANVHRGVHFLSERATTRYEAARETVRGFLNARSAREIVFTHGGTEAINLVASSYGRHFLEAGDEIIISVFEHHSNIVPWQMARDAKGLVLKAAPVTDDGELPIDAFERLFTPRTKLVAISHMSNVLGTVFPARRIAEIAHAHGAKVLFDGCQAACHVSVDVQDIDCDFYVFSGHKVYGPSGIGILYARGDLLASIPPYQGGGEMIDRVSLEKTTWAPPPARFEAGTPPIVQAIGLGAALDYVASVGRDRIASHEADLTKYAMQRLAAVDGLRLIGTAPTKSSVVAFTLDAVHPHDVATVLDRAGVAVRAGHHCAQPLMQRLGVTATARASFAMYNTRAEVDALGAALELAREFFA
ncbi:MAG: cysteine desulfurase [Rhodospirillales bacterium]|jgi:cysteine desulfurase/selenocysteine lyase|nr:cysteine desulfurase [Rhodospirillales bacterium]MDP6805140.1 cysteine desulfurase [Rhodospirillales bacterium]